MVGGIDRDTPRFDDSDQNLCEESSANSRESDSSDCEDAETTQEKARILFEKLRDKFWTKFIDGKDPPLSTQTAKSMSENSQSDEKPTEQIIGKKCDLDYSNNSPFNTILEKRQLEFMDHKELKSTITHINSLSGGFSKSTEPCINVKSSVGVKNEDLRLGNATKNSDKDERISRKKSNKLDSVKSKKGNDEFRNIVNQIRNLAYPHLDEFQRKQFEEKKKKLLGLRESKNRKMPCWEMISAKKNLKKKIENLKETEKELDVKLYTGDIGFHHKNLYREKKIKKKKKSGTMMKSL